MPFSCPYLRAVLGLLLVLAVAPAIAATNYSYDGGEALATLPGPHAISSYTKNGARHDLAYDRNGDLESISGSMNTSYTYNTLRKLKEATHSSGEVTKHFYTATGGRIATIRQSDSSLDVFAEGFLRFTHGNTRFSYGAIEENENGDNFVLKITDHLGSVIASANSTQILNQRDYLPYGQEWISSTTFTDQNFNGHLKQGDLIDYNARHYLPELGKFIQMDSIIPKTDAVGFNRSAYVSNNPVNRVDPSGHDDGSYLSGLPENTSASFNISRMEQGLYHARYNFDVDGVIAHRGDAFLTRGNAMIGYMETTPDFRRMGFSGAAHELIETRVSGIRQWNQREWVGTNEAWIKRFGFPNTHLVMDRMGYNGYVSKDQSFWAWVNPGSSEELDIIMSDMYRELPDNPRGIVARAMKSVRNNLDNVSPKLKVAGKRAPGIIGALLTTAAVLSSGNAFAKTMNPGEFFGFIPYIGDILEPSTLADGTLQPGQEFYDWNRPKYKSSFKSIMSLYE